MTPEVLIWRDYFHDKQEGERLHFFRLSFAASYDRERIDETLAGIYAELRVRSYITYELLGEYDLLLRLWVPNHLPVDEVELKMWHELNALGIWNINYISCQTTLHWARLRQIAGDAHEPPDIPDDHIRLANEYNADQWAAWRSGEPALERPPELDALVADDCLFAVPLDTRGVRFFVTFDHPKLPFNPNTKQFAAKLIREKCLDVAERWSAKEGIPRAQISVYEGHGSMSDFLVMARAPYGHFHKFVRELVLGLRATQLTELFGVRPYTHVIADEMFSEFREFRQAVPPAEALNLNGEESETLEFKATFGMDFRGYIVAGRKDVKEDRMRSIARGVCGMLNSPDGGTLVIGVLEVRRELPRVPDWGAYLGKLQAEFGYNAPALNDDGLPPDLPNAVIGIEAEVGRGKPFADDDVYLRRVTDVLRSTINPNPLPYLKIGLQRVDDRRVCVIQARPAEEWFYARTDDKKHEEFIVREAAASRAYHGAESDLYKRAHPRGSNPSDGHK